jgi:predicted HTH transcriptional regulator
MSEENNEELKQKIVEFFKKKNKMLTSRDVAAGLEIENRDAKKILIEMVNEGTLEFTSFGGATFIKLLEES